MKENILSIVFGTLDSILIYLVYRHENLKHFRKLSSHRKLKFRLENKMIFYFLLSKKDLVNAEIKIKSKNQHYSYTSFIQWVKNKINAFQDKRMNGHLNSFSG